jgi:PAS domain S-box-containing protein
MNPGAITECKTTESPLGDWAGIVDRPDNAEALRVSADLLRKVIDCSSDYIFVKDRELRIILCNQAYAKALGKSIGKVCGRTDIENGWSLELVKGNQAEGIKGWESDDRATLSGETIHVVGEPANIGRGIRVLDTVRSPLRGTEGEIVGLVGVSRDITDRTRAEEEVRRTGSYNRSLIEASLDPLVIIRPDGIIRDVNVATEKTTGYFRKELIGTDFADYCTDPEKARRGYQQAFRQGAIQDYELQLLRRDGLSIPILYNASVYRNEDGTIAGVVATARDITERKRAAEELSSANHQLRQLSMDLLRSQDYERRRIARELHDSTAQLLAALRMNLIRTRDSKLEPKRKGELLTEAIDLTTACSREIRTVSYLLHPPLLEEVGLLGAVQSYSEGFQQRTGIQIELNCPSEFGRIEGTLEIALFRILQEGLANIHRHSGSPRAEILLEQDATTVRLELRDWGRGLSTPASGPERGAVQFGVGILGMRERTEQLGGRLEIAGADIGTRLTVSLPLVHS